MQTMVKENKFIGLIGFGYWGKNILRNLYELGILHSACDTDRNNILERKERFPEIQYTSSVEEILKEPEITAVAIATPASTHYRLVKQALNSGKDVFVEKPLSLTVKEGEKIVALAKKKKKILMVGHILQYHPAIISLKDLISKGALGKIQYVYSNRLNIGKLRTEENILWSFAPHDISVILALLGEEPKEISTFGGDFLNQGICDTTITTMEFKNGVKAHIFVSWLHPFKEQKLIVVGTKAMAVFDDLSEKKLVVYSHKIEWKEGKIPVAQKADYKIIPLEKKEPLKEEMLHFVECVTERKNPISDGHEGLKVLKVLESAEKGLEFRSPPKKVSGSTSYYLHESSYVDKEVNIGNGTKIWHFSHMLRDSVIGKDCVIGQNVIVGPEVNIGDGCKVQNNVSLYKGITLEEGVFCGPSCVFTNVYNPRAFIERKQEFLPTLVKKGATIGANATIICGITIGKYAMIGAGAVVKKDVPDHAIVAGVPARHIGWSCQCGTSLKFIQELALCSYCEKEYNLVGKMKIKLRRKMKEH